MLPMNLARREEAQAVAERAGDVSVVIIRQAGDSGSLYGSVTPRDIADAATADGLSINRTQVQLDQPIKTLGLSEVRVVLHPEVTIKVTVNVARSVEEAERQARGETVAVEEDEGRAYVAEQLGDDFGAQSAEARDGAAEG